MWLKKKKGITNNITYVPLTRLITSLCNFQRMSPKIICTMNWIIHSSPISLLLTLLTTQSINMKKICGNKMPTRCNRCFLLQILLLAQHVSGTITPIIRSSRVLYSWLLPVVFGAWFSSCRCGVELRVMCPVYGLQPANQAPKTTGSNQLYNTLELLMTGIMVPETCWASNKVCNKKTSVASSWHFISTY